MGGHLPSLVVTARVKMSQSQLDLPQASHTSLLNSIVDQEGHV